VSRLKVAFVVQGEGRGHMTQALALGAFLRDAGHEIMTVLVGRSPFRSLPDYFTGGIAAPVETFDSPAQVPGADGRGVSIARTARDAARRMPRFVAGGLRVHRATRPADVVVNFLDLVGGVSRLIFRSRVPAVAVAHNYVFLHPALSGAPGGRLVKRLVLGWARATAGGAATRVALSFDPLPPAPDRSLVVAPPLLRPGLETVRARDDGYLLAYALNAGYGDMLAAWQRRNPDVTLHCYLDGGAAALRSPAGPGFHAHALNDRVFLDHLAGCRAYVGSAGFESICEAFYLGKPVLAVPTAGQHEQTLNAWDAGRAGAARHGGYDGLDDFWGRPPTPSRGAVERFRAWVASAPAALVGVVERAAARGRSPAAGTRPAGTRPGGTRPGSTRPGGRNGGAGQGGGP
jgi:hypothetical protein